MDPQSYYALYLLIREESLIAMATTIYGTNPPPIRGTISKGQSNKTLFYTPTCGLNVELAVVEPIKNADNTLNMCTYQFI